jgi:predicted CXXCH cytochrome family protein
MTFRIHQISTTADGREIIRTSDVAGNEIRIGRALDCDIHLADLAVALDHARARRRADGGLEFDAVDGASLLLNGRTVQHGVVAPSEGAELHLGGHQLAIAAESDGAIGITVRRVEAISQSAADPDAKPKFSLAAALPGKRPMAWALLGIILLAFLAIPVISNLLREDKPGATVAMDKSWSTGPLSTAHHALEKDCTACHVTPFEPVQDKACLTCHENTHDHASPARLDASRPAPGMGEAFLRKVAVTFGKPGPGACVDCHSEHEGAQRMQPVRQAFCADCHDGIGSRLQDTALGDASDFGTAHPEFKALVAEAPAVEPRYTRVSLADKPVDANGLTFPHDVHLEKRGSVARMAQALGKAGGYGAPLDCVGCHQPTADGVRFMPVEMERNCGSCHSLAYDKIGGTVRRLKHGDFAQMVADLRAAEQLGASVSGNGQSGRTRPAAPYRATFPAPFGNSALARAVSPGGICGECHTVTRGGDVSRWTVEPVHQTARYFQKGWFDHKPHRQEQCSSCHTAEKSAKASDLLLPDIAQCRTCHMGENDKKADVPSTCAMCHNYHVDDGAPWLGARGSAVRFSAATFRDPRLKATTP